MKAFPSIIKKATIKSNKIKCILIKDVKKL